ncbi:MAG: hypothetical protein CL577_08880 [Alteromonadaceae bacterium]|uniref:hypothetical protein n=1 Tax=Rheinheimera aquimaris TaxID=412437 RepID=UPI000C5BACA9|nr:hypothetical protein [Rheinheimera aquimaris]MBJ92692.1 hypothetical protein [Alteromonadaceae bacterium]
MNDLTFDQIDQVSGAGFMEGAGAAGLALGIGSAAFGSGWGAVGVGLAFAASPLAAGAMVGLAFYAGYQMLQ